MSLRMVVFNAITGCVKYGNLEFLNFSEYNTPQMTSQLEGFPISSLLVGLSEPRRWRGTSSRLSQSMDMDGGLGESSRTSWSESLSPTTERFPSVPARQSVADRPLPTLPKSLVSTEITPRTSDGVFPPTTVWLLTGFKSWVPVETQSGWLAHGDVATVIVRVLDPDAIHGTPPRSSFVPLEVSPSEQQMALPLLTTNNTSADGGGNRVDLLHRSGSISRSRTRTGSSPLFRRRVESLPSHVDTEVLSFTAAREAALAQHRLREAGGRSLPGSPPFVRSLAARKASLSDTKRGSLTPKGLKKSSTRSKSRKSRSMDRQRGKRGSSLDSSSRSVRVTFLSSSVMTPTTSTTAVESGTGSASATTTSATSATATPRDSGSSSGSDSGSSSGSSSGSDTRESDSGSKESEDSGSGASSGGGRRRRGRRRRGRAGVPNRVGLSFTLTESHSLTSSTGSVRSMGSSTSSVLSQPGEEPASTAQLMSHLVEMDGGPPVVVPFSSCRGDHQLPRWDDLVALVEARGSGETRADSGIPAAGYLMKCEVKGAGESHLLSRVVSVVSMGDPLEGEEARVLDGMKGEFFWEFVHPEDSTRVQQSVAGFAEGLDAHSVPRREREFAVQYVLRWRVNQDGGGDEYVPMLATMYFMHTLECKVRMVGVFGLDQLLGSSMLLDSRRMYSLAKSLSMGVCLLSLPPGVLESRKELTRHQLESQSTCLFINGAMLRFAAGRSAFEKGGGSPSAGAGPDLLEKAKIEASLGRGRLFGELDFGGDMVSMILPAIASSLRERTPWEVEVAVFGDSSVEEFDVSGSHSSVETGTEPFRYLRFVSQVLQSGDVCLTCQDISAEQRLLLETVRNHKLTSAKVFDDVERQALQEFLRCTSHDIRTPLQGVTSAALLVHTNIAEYQRKLEACGPKTKEVPTLAVDDTLELVDIISASAQMLDMILANVLDVETIKKGGLKLELSPTYLSRRLLALVSVLQYSTSQKEDVTLNVNLPPFIPPVMCDGNRLLRVVMNLLVNAAKFTTRGSVTLSVSCRTEAERGEDLGGTAVLDFAVEDTGSGMTAEELTHVGELYSHAAVEKGGGSGIGLFNVVHSLRAMNSEVRITSTIGMGTRVEFSVKFPIHLGLDRDALAVGRALNVSGSTSGSTGGGSSRSPSAGEAEPYRSLVSGHVHVGVTSSAEEGIPTGPLRMASEDLDLGTKSSGKFPFLGKEGEDEDYPRFATSSGSLEFSGTTTTGSGGGGGGGAGRRGKGETLPLPIDPDEIASRRRRSLSQLLASADDEQRKGRRGKGRRGRGESGDLYTLTEQPLSLVSRVGLSHMTGERGGERGDPMSSMMAYSLPSIEERPPPPGTVVGDGGAGPSSAVVTVVPADGEDGGKSDGGNRRDQHVKSLSANSLPVVKVVKSDGDKLEEGGRSSGSLSPGGRSSGSLSPGEGSPLLLPVEKPLGMEVLFVEDNVINRKVGKRLVERLGHVVDVACDGGEALDMLRQEEKVYDIVFMDISMPVYRGTEVTELFREWEAELMARDPKRKYTPIYALTGNVTEDDRAACYEAGCDGFIPKPCVPASLERAFVEVRTTELPKR